MEFISADTESPNLTDDGKGNYVITVSKTLFFITLASVAYYFVFGFKIIDLTGDNHPKKRPSRGRR
jgi:hypothetical protein